MSVLSEIQNLHKGMDTVLCESVVKGLSPICRYAICLSSALICSRKYVVLDWKPLARLQEDERKIILDALSDRVVVLVSLNGQGPLVSVASLVVVMDDKAVRGIGDQLWYNQFSESAAGKKEFMSVLGDIRDDEDDLDFDD